MGAVLFTLTLTAVVAVMFFFLEGIVAACTMFLNVLLAGLVAFNFWEPLASQLEDSLAGTKALGYEDALALVFLFWVTLGVLRVLTNFLTHVEYEFHPRATQIGSCVFGILTGYLVSGFLLCAFQTLPWDEHFWGFEPRYQEGRTLRHVLPADRIWLALMHRAGAVPFGRTARTFDPDGTFELRYARYRRFTDSRPPNTYQGELDPPPAAAPP